MIPISERFFGGRLIGNAPCKRISGLPDSLSDFTRYFEQGLNLAKENKLERTPVQGDGFWNEFIDESMIASRRNPKLDNSDFFLSQPEF